MRTKACLLIYYSCFHYLFRYEFLKAFW